MHSKICNKEQSFVPCMCITYSTPGGYFDNDTEHFCTVEINGNPVTENGFITRKEMN